MMTKPFVFSMFAVALALSSPSLQAQDAPAIVETLPVIDAPGTDATRTVISEVSSDESALASVRASISSRLSTEEWTAVENQITRLAAATLMQIMRRPEHQSLEFMNSIPSHEEFQLQALASFEEQLNASLSGFGDAYRICMRSAPASVSDEELALRTNALEQSLHALRNAILAVVSFGEPAFSNAIVETAENSFPIEHASEGGLEYTPTIIEPSPALSAYGLYNSMSTLLNEGFSSCHYIGDITLLRRVLAYHLGYAERSVHSRHLPLNTITRVEERSHEVARHALTYLQGLRRATSFRATIAALENRPETMEAAQAQLRTAMTDFMRASRRLLRLMGYFRR